MFPSPFRDQVFDPSAAFPEVAQWRAVVSAGDWFAVAAIFYKFDDPDSRSYAVRVIGGIRGSEDFFAKVVAEGVGGALAQVLSSRSSTPPLLVARHTRPR